MQTSPSHKVFNWVQIRGPWQRESATSLDPIPLKSFPIAGSLGQHGGVDCQSAYSDRDNTDDALDYVIGPG